MESNVSTSVQRALDWANAVARIREEAPPGERPSIVDEADLFVGILLAHPDPGGELPVLLDHFGMTVRDIVGEAYSRVNPATLAAALASVSAGAQSPDDPPLSRVFELATSLSQGRVQLLHVLGAVLTVQGDLSVRLEDAFTQVGEDLRSIAESYRDWLRTEPQHEGIAGESLRKWLAEHNARKPVGVAGFATDDVPGHALAQPRDLVGISPEANALAYLVASPNLVPPLAIGLFGDWGAGKSFLMRDVRTRVDRLAQLAQDQSPPGASSQPTITHIQFNAWEYIQGDLWSALLEKVFTALDTSRLEASLVTERRKPIRDELDHQKQVVTDARQRADELETDRATAAADVEKAQSELDRRQKEAADQTARAAKDLVRKALATQWTEGRLSGLGSNVDDLVGALQDAWNELRLGSAVLGPYWRQPRHVILFVLAVFIPPAITWALQALTDIPAVSAAVAALALATSVLTVWLRSVTGWIRTQRIRIEQARAEVEALLQAPVEEARGELAEAEARLEEAERATAEQATIVAAEEAREARLGDELEAITPGRVLVEFAAERSTDYRSKLGLLGRVREDLTRLRDEIAENSSRRGGGPSAEYDATVPDRIVLYIDDLDRCPPDKVVQVLEAVHLLLAFPMFVVFVAVDSRWLSSALIEELHALKTTSYPRSTVRRDTPTARDYLEKIFQLAFWVQPLSLSERSSIVAGLLAPVVRSGGDGAGTTEPGPELGRSEAEALQRMLDQSGRGLRLETSTLSLSRAEFEFVTSLGPLLGDTPRRVKRFVNTVQFLLSIQPSLESAGERPPRQSVALFAAIHQGLPTIGSAVFAPENAGLTLSQVLGSPSIDEQERESLDDWLSLPAHLPWRQARIGEIGNHSEMVQRLGFDRPRL